MMVSSKVLSLFHRTKELQISDISKFWMDQVKVRETYERKKTSMYHWLTDVYITPSHVFRRQLLRFRIGSMIRHFQDFQHIVSKLPSCMAVPQGGNITAWTPVSMYIKTTLIIPGTGVSGKFLNFRPLYSKCHPYLLLISSSILYTPFPLNLTLRSSVLPPTPASNPPISLYDQVWAIIISVLAYFQHLLWVCQLTPWPQNPLATHKEPSLKAVWLLTTAHKAFMWGLMPPTSSQTSKLPCLCYNFDALNVPQDLPRPELMSTLQGTLLPIIPQLSAPWPPPYNCTLAHTPYIFSFTITKNYFICLICVFVSSLSSSNRI